MTTDREKAGSAVAPDQQDTEKLLNLRKQIMDQILGHERLIEGLRNQLIGINKAIEIWQERES